MKKPKSFYLKINKLTIFVFLLSLISGRFVPLLTYFFIALIHELFHCFAALFLRVKINKIEILPFGLVASINDLNYIHPYKAIIILIMGPLSYFFSLFMINIIYDYNLISNHLFLAANKTNLIILLFNLLPIYPLDGSKILLNILSFFLPLKRCYNIYQFISILTMFLLIFLTINNPSLMIVFFLLFSNLKFIFEKDLLIKKIYLKRLGNSNNYKDKIHSKLDLYLPYKNYYLKGDLYLFENELITKILLMINN